MKLPVAGLLLASVLLAALVPSSAGAVLQSPPQSNESQAFSSSESTLGKPLELSPIQSEEAERYEVTLITGDVVVVSIAPGGEKGIAIMPADPRAGQSFHVLERPVGRWASGQKDSSKEETPEVINNTYVIPGDVDLTRLDIELFNIDYLIKEKYYELSYLPVLLVAESKTRTTDVRAMGLEVEAVAESVDYHSMFSTVSAQLSLENIAGSYKTMMKLDYILIANQQEIKRYE